MIDSIQSSPVSTLKRTGMRRVLRRMACAVVDEVGVEGVQHVLQRVQGPAAPDPCDHQK